MTRYNVANSDNVTDFSLTLQDYLTDYILGKSTLILSYCGDISEKSGGRSKVLHFCELFGFIIE